MESPHLPTDSARIVVHGKVGRYGRLVIPQPIRQQLSLETGEPIAMAVVDGELHISSLRERARQAQAWVRTFRPPGTSLVEELRQLRSKDLANDRRP